MRPEKNPAPLIPRYSLLEQVVVGLVVIEKERKEEYLCSAISVCHTRKALRHGSHSFTCKLHHTCLSFVSVHQKALPLTEVADIYARLQCLQCFDTVGWAAGKSIRPVKNMGYGGHWLVRMEWRPARWSVCLPLLILPCTIKSGSYLLAPAYPGGPGKWP